jgi:hypothetical protein
MSEGKGWEGLLITVAEYNKLVFKVGNVKKTFTRKKLGMERKNGQPKHVWNTLVLMAAAQDNEMTRAYVESKKDYRE